MPPRSTRKKPPSVPQKKPPRSLQGNVPQVDSPKPGVLGLSPAEHQQNAADFRAWAGQEKDPQEQQRLEGLAQLSEALAAKRARQPQSSAPMPPEQTVL